MADLTYRFCQYTPSLYEPSEIFPFGVVVASDREIFLYALDISDLGVEVAWPPGIPHKKLFDVMHNRILRVLEKGGCPTSGHEALARLGGLSPTNITLTEVGPTDEFDSAKEAAEALCCKVIQALEDHRIHSPQGSWKSGFRSARESLDSCLVG